MIRFVTLDGEKWITEMNPNREVTTLLIPSGVSLRKQTGWRKETEEDSALEIRTFMEVKSKLDCREFFEAEVK